VSQVRKQIYTLGDFKEMLSRRIAEERFGQINIQDDAALELINEVLPRNLMLTRLFQESDGISIMDTPEKGR